MGDEVKRKPDRQARLEAALRENLKRRKAQARGRAVQDETPQRMTDTDCGGEPNGAPPGKNA